MKELLLIGTTVITLATSSITIGTAQASSYPTNTRTSHSSVSILEYAESKAMEEARAEAELLKKMKLQKNTDMVNATINQLNKYVNKTWYVFSGHTPSGWDCSGLTMWFYEQLEIELKHSATAQALGGQRITDPKPGDLVAFHYENSKKAYHVGIYIGNGMMIHSPRPGKATEIIKVDDFGGANSDISYVRYIDTI